jgi:SAM-dependent methyltransferase
MAASAEECPYTLKTDRYSSHAQIADYLRRYAKTLPSQPCRVLDIGCASGFLRPFLPSSTFHLMGMERQPELVEQAKRWYDEVYQADLNDPVLLPLNPLPDCIVLADVLEHLPEPDRVLGRLLRQYAKPGAPVIISLPNVAHLYIRLSLLLGRFSYTERGILDRTHLRFFTLYSARQLCMNSGIQLRLVRATPLPLPLIHPLFGRGQPLALIHACSAALSHLFKGLLAYQFILIGVYEP